MIPSLLIYNISFSFGLKVIAHSTRGMNKLLSLNKP